MARIHDLGFPRIGARRELKLALEKHWRGALSHDALEDVGREIRRDAWRRQAGLDLVPVGDFSFYDHVLDLSFLLGNVPPRAGSGHALDRVFRLARGRAAGDADEGVAAGAMKKYFDTNYHFIAPELSLETTFALDAARLLAQIAEARAAGVNAKPVLVGPVTYLWLGKVKDGSDPLALLPKLLPVYRALLEALAADGIGWVQLDEPALVTELAPAWQDAYRRAYAALVGAGPRILLATYFGRLEENLPLAASLPVAGLHLDAVSAPLEIAPLAAGLRDDQVLSVGIISGRNVWATDLARALDTLEPLHRQLGDRLWLAPSCSLLHVPVDLANERKLDPELLSWLSFAEQKLGELRVLGAALTHGRDEVKEALERNGAALASRRGSPRVHDPAVRAAVEAITPRLGERRSPYPRRAEIQRATFALPAFPTTTIGSFPQTADIRRARSEFKAGKMDNETYEARMRAEIAHAVREQEALGLDVLVHGEAERNDMVEYFGERLAGYAFSEHGWVQSYGSRCVKPPILFGDISRPSPMTVAWTTYAQSLTQRPMKGMLTGPVTILGWSFVRDDQPRSTTCHQIALAIREEVHDLERAGVRMIQIDEAALREGLPLRRAEQAAYLDWAVSAFRLTANGVADATQIHTHMCYSDFNDIIAAIAAMDTDVITIETSRSAMELLDVFDRFRYPSGIGPGVYDIHSPNVPSEDRIVALMTEAARKIAPAQLWVNPDCGLKTRTWEEVRPALANMVGAAKRLRAGVGGRPVEAS